MRNRISTECFISKWKWDSIGLKEAWFFPEYKGVKGYLGTDKIIFIALNPSFGRFPSKGDKLFYGSLIKYGFQNAHLTDIFKLRLSRDQYNEIRKKELFIKLLKRHIGWLEKELKIIDKKLNIKIVAVGDEAFNILSKYFKSEIIGKMHHYSWAERYAKRREFKKEMKDIADKIKNRDAC